MRSPISKKVYHERIKGQLSDHQNQKVLQLMREIAQPQTIRMLHRTMNARGFEIDLVSLRRAVTNLTKTDPRGNWKNQWKKPMLFVEFEKPCPITKVTVGWYNCVNHSQQMNLFNQTNTVKAA